VYLGLPAFNEELAIAPLFGRIRSARSELLDRRLAKDLVVLFYDDGSTDDTAQEVKNSANGLNLFLLSPESNGGLGVALRGLFTEFVDQASSGDVLVIMDADDTHDPSQISQLLAEMDGKPADVVIASRYRKGARVNGVPGYRQFLSFGFAGLVKVVLPIRGVLDYSCGYRAYTYESVAPLMTEQGFPLHETGFSAMPEVLIRLRRRSLVFREIPLQLSYDRRLTVSKMRAWENSKRLLSRVITWRFRSNTLKSSEDSGSLGSRKWWTTSQLHDGDNSDG
jgi:dolichol-phosphate mannosyltransferase